MPIDRLISPSTSQRELRANREFAFTLAVAFLVFALLALRKARYPVASVSFGIAIVLFLAGLVLPGRLSRVRRAWMMIGEMIGRVTTPLLMGALYYLILTPIAVVRRARRRDRSARVPSWHPRPPLPPPARMERQF